MTAGGLLRGKSLICPVWMRLSSKVANVNGTFQLVHPEDLPHDCATQTVSWLLEALHPAPNDQRFAAYLACWSDTARPAAATEEPRDAMASTSSPQMHGRQTQGRELTAQQVMLQYLTVCPLMYPEFLVLKGTGLGLDTASCKVQPTVVWQPRNA